MPVLLTILIGLIALIFMVIKLKIPAFMALLLVSICVGLGVGMEPAAVLDSIESGMGGTLGFVAVVVGLGAMLGAMLEISGGVHVIASALLKRSGENKASWMLGFIGFIVAIPVFFDVAFIILVPMLYTLARDSKRSVLNFAIPVLAGLTVTHAFIPPTPGPIAVAEILGADLGWVIVFGFCCGLPAMILAGPLFARKFRALPLESFLRELSEDNSQNPVASLSFSTAMFIITTPLLLIVLSTASGQLLEPSLLLDILSFIGHPFVALMIACLLAYGILSTKASVSSEHLMKVMTRSLEPAGVVVLVTGAGAVFKQILTDSGGGLLLTEMMAGFNLSPYVFAFIVALLVRVSQGSATVAMITAAGLTAPILENLSVVNPVMNALLVIAIAAGATSFSHVNDSGFWLVSRYLHLTEANTLKTWTILTAIVGFTGFAMVLLLSVLVM